MVLRGTTTQKAGRVLVINADPEIIRILEVNLAHANLEVVSAQSGAEALSKIQTDKSDIIILEPSLPDMDCTEIFRKIKELPQTSRIPIIIISAKPRKICKIANAEDIAIRYITKPFDPKEVVALVQGYLMHKERMVNINPLTGLPNQIQVNNEIAKLIRQKNTFAAIYIAMHDFKAINKTYGYDQGDRVIQLLADIVSEAVRLFGNPDDLAGHVNGDKFVVVSTPYKARTLCRRIIADFNRRIKALYTDEHLQMGHAAYESPSDSKEQTPIMSIHLAVVTNQKRTFNHHLEVSETASEQIEYLRRSTESNCYFDVKANGIELPLTLARRDTTHINKEELKALQGVLAWFNFLIGELDIPVTEIKNRLHSLEYIKAENLSQEQQDSLKALQENYSHLTRVIEGIANVARSEELRAGAFFDEVDIGHTLSWVMEQVEKLAEQKGIKAEIEVAGNVGRIIGDKKSLTQSLLYILRSEIHSSPTESRLHIRVTEKNEESINIEITSPNHYFSTRALNTLLQGQPDISQQEILKNELYPVGILVRGLGGKLDVTSEKQKGTIYTLTIPKKWQSWMQEVDTLQLAMEISRKEARDALKNIQRIVSSLMEQVPPALKDAYERLGSKVQELGVLCNRSLFLADDLSNRLEAQQDRLLQQEVEQLTTLEAILTICREIAKSMHVGNIFDLESARRVAEYALSIAGEFKLSESDRQALRYAALFKDLGLALSPKDMVEQKVATTLEEAMAIRVRYDLVWKTLSTIRFLITALDFVLYRYERYDGTGGRFGVKGTDIPLGSRILAIADTFDSITSGRSPQGKLTLKMAMQKIVEDSGLCFDPHVVGAFLMLWKRKELNTVPSESSFKE
jgi:diguanylate cyclase (GGDEF)-like protein